MRCVVGRSSTVQVRPKGPAAVAAKLHATPAPAGGPVLRDYQTTAVLAVLARFVAGIFRVLLFAPTGAGKTVMFAALAARARAAGLTVLVVAHRLELLDQAAAKLAAAGVPSVVYRGARDARRLAGATCVVASVQTRDLDALRRSLGPSLVIVDEAHHTPAPSYQRLAEVFPDALFLGATATPWWGEGKGLGGCFGDIVTAASARELTERGFLARARIFTHPDTFEKLDLRGLARDGGDYARKALSERMDTPTLIGDIVAHWKTHAGGQPTLWGAHAGGRPTLCFAASVEHSRHLVARFCAAGVAAEHVDGETPEEERTAILARLKRGTTRVVSNYGVLTEGFDAPAVGCVVLARPTRRLGVYLQAIGRGLRVDGAKDDVVVLDHAGTCLVFGFPDDDHLVSLDATGEEESETRPGLAPVRRCPTCELMVPASTRTCPECEGTLRETVPIEDMGGVLVESLRGQVARTLTHDGRTLTVAQWSLETGISAVLINWRLRRGMSIDRVLAQPASRITVEYNGRRVSLTDLSRMTGINRATLKARKRKGMSVDQMLASTVRAKIINHNGRTMTVAQAAKELGVDPSTINLRLRKGAAAAEALSPLRGHETLTHNGRTLTILEWAKELGIPVKKIRVRLRKKMSVAEVLAPSSRGAVRLLEHDGHTLTVAQWAKVLGISVDAIYKRLAAGASIAEALAPRKRSRPTRTGRRSRPPKTVRPARARGGRRNAARRSPHEASVQ